MQWQLSPSVMVETGTALGILILAACFPWRDISRRATLIGFMLLLIAALWIFTHSLEIGTPIASYKAYLMGLQLIWGLLALTLWLLYITQYTTAGKWHTGRNYALFGIMPCLAIVALTTNHIYGLMWTAPGLNATNPYLPLEPTYGMFYWGAMAYMGVLIVCGCFQVVKIVVRQPNFRKWEPWVLILSAVIPLLVAFLEVTGVTEYTAFSIGITPIFSCIGIIGLVWTLPRFHLQKIIPIARNIVFEHIGDCVVVLNMQNRIVDLNPAAEHLAGYTSAEALGLPVEKIWPNWPSQLTLSTLPSIGYTELDLTRKGEQRTYDLRIYTIVDDKSRPLNNVALLIDTTEQKRAEKELKQNHEQLKRAFEAIVKTISTIVEMKDPYTAGHQLRVAQLARAIAQEIGLTGERANEIFTASLIHDIGKMQVPVEILSKPGELSVIEFALIKLHCQAGYDILKNADFPYPLCSWVLEHHERINGSGYPNGLTEGQISLEAKILAVSDVVEAISSHRPYRPALNIGVALEEISNNRGKLFDADIVEACLKLFKVKGFKFE
jgi:PAS domain S-box-containing protein